MTIAALNRKDKEFDTISGEIYRSMICCAAERLREHEQQINDLNVFPVPDGDTGTNMMLTACAASTELSKCECDTVGKVADRAASAMLRGARGNSGVILSLIFRGIARSLKECEKADSQVLALAVRDGVDAAYKAVMKPAEGTILTVSRAAAKAAEGRPCRVEEMLSRAVEAAKIALEKTTDQNPVLKRAGVVDAGGFGFTVILEAFLDAVRGEWEPGTEQVVKPQEKQKHESAFSRFSTEEITYAYDTVFIVSKTEKTGTLAPFREYLESIGDSLVISEDDELFKVHVHTNIPGSALNEASKYGILETAKIENMRTQHEELLEDDDDDEPQPANTTQADEPEENEELAEAPAEKALGFVAVCAGEGIEQLFRDLGADAVVTGGQTMNPSTEDILRAVNSTPAETVFVFPNNKNIIMAAQQVAPLTSKKVVVIPTKTVPQGIAAMISLDPEATEEELTESFNAAIEPVHTALITYAARDSEFDGMDIRAGEYLCMLEGTLIGSYKHFRELLDDLTADLNEFAPEIITIYYGVDVPEDSAKRMETDISKRFPDCDVQLVNGGQPVYYYMISAE